MLYNSPYRSGILAATVFLGMLLGGLIVGCFGDWYGRRPLLLIGLCTCSITGFLSALCTDVWTLSICRFFAGLGIGATVPPLFALCSELAPPKHRGYYVTIVASFWMVGSIYVAIIGWIILGGTNNHKTDPNVPNIEYTTQLPLQQEDSGFSSSSIHWRVFAAMCALPSALGCILVLRLIPESPRFLLLQDRHEEALSILHYLTRICMKYHGQLITLDELYHHYPPTTQITIIPPPALTTNTEYYHDDHDSAVTRSTVNSVSASSRSQSNNNISNIMKTTQNTFPSPTEMTDSPIAANTFYQSIPVRNNNRAGSNRTSTTTTSTCTAAVRRAVSEFVISTSQLYSNNLKSTTWSLQVVWFSLSFGSYGLLTWINTLFEKVHLKNVYFNALLFSLSNLPGNILSAYYMDKLGRSRLLTGSILLAALSLISFAYEASIEDYDDGNDMANGNNNSTSNNNTDYNKKLARSRTLIVLSACAFQCFTIAAWNSIDVLTSELFPTSVRATGMGVCAATGRIGAMLAQFINGWLVSNPTRLLLVAAGTLVIGSITPAWLPSDQTGKPVHDYTNLTDNNNDDRTIVQERCSIFRNVEDEDDHDGISTSQPRQVEVELSSSTESISSGNNRHREKNSSESTTTKRHYIV